MDDIMKTDVDEDLIAPYMADINRQFEYIDKEDIIKKMVSNTFGKFLDYYKNAPEIVQAATERERIKKKEETWARVVATASVVRARLRPAIAACSSILVRPMGSIRVR
jgi:hypothetical protein